MRGLFGEQATQEVAGIGLLVLGYLFRRSFGDYAPTSFTAFGSEVDDPVGTLDDFQVMLDHDNGVPGINKALQDLEQAIYVREVQTRRRLIQDIERATCSAAG
jgi:hypothetical protein